MFERGFQRQVFRRTVEGSERTIGPLAASQLRRIIELLNALDDIGLPTELSAQSLSTQKLQPKKSSA
jgi:hypothetical protein